MFPTPFQIFLSKLFVQLFQNLAKCGIQDNWVYPNNTFQVIYWSVNIHTLTSSHKLWVETERVECRAVPPHQEDIWHSGIWPRCLQGEPFQVCEETSGEELKTSS